MNARVIRFTIFVCTLMVLTIFRNAFVAAQEPEVDDFRELGLLVELERLPTNLRGDQFSKIQNVCIPADWNGKLQALEILQNIQPRRFGQHTLYLLGPSKITLEMVEPIATRLGWKVGRSPAVFVGISWNSQTPPFTVLHVFARSPANIAGVMKGDTIKQIGDNKIQDYASFRDALLTYLPGDETVLILERDGTELTLELKLAALPVDVNRPEN